MAVCVDIRDFGAIGDGIVLNTQAIQSAFDEASLRHAEVLVADGVYRSGALFMRPGMALHIDSGGCLRGSRDPADYPVAETRFEGRSCLWPLALLNAQGLDGVAIYGKGILDGDGLSFWKRFWDGRRAAIEKNEPFSNRDVMRPRLIFIDSCTNVCIREIALTNSAFWHLHLYNSQQIRVEGISVEAPHQGTRAASSDAIDIDACSNVVVTDCRFETDDDCVCIKGGKGPQAHLTNSPTENIVIKDCFFGFGHGVVTFGSEAALVRNVHVHDCHVKGENSLVRMKFREDTCQSFENIVFERIWIDHGGWLFDVQSWVSRQDEILGTGNPSQVANLIVRDIQAYGMKSPGILGYSTDGSLRMENVSLQHIHITGVQEDNPTLTRADAVEKQIGAKPEALVTGHGMGFSMEDVTFDGQPLTFIPLDTLDGPV